MQTEQAKAPHKTNIFSIKKAIALSIKNKTKIDSNGLSYLKNVSKQSMNNSIKDHVSFIARWEFSTLKQGVKISILKTRIEKDFKKHAKEYSVSPDKAPRGFLDWLAKRKEEI